MSAPKTYSREWFIAQARDAEEKVAELRRLFPGCFNPDGSAIVASAHFERAATDDIDKPKRATKGGAS